MAMSLQRLDFLMFFWTTQITMQNASGLLCRAEGVDALVYDIKQFLKTFQLKATSIIDWVQKGLVICIFVLQKLLP